MGVDLVRQGVDPGLHEQRLLLPDPVLDAGVVPDLDRGRDAQKRAEVNHHRLEQVLRLERIHPRRPPAVDFELQELQRGQRELLETPAPLAFFLRST